MLGLQDMSIPKHHVYYRHDFSDERVGSSSSYVPNIKLTTRFPKPGQFARFDLMRRTTLLMM